MGWWETDRKESGPAAEPAAGTAGKSVHSPGHIPRPALLFLSDSGLWHTVEPGRIASDGAVAGRGINSDGPSSHAACEMGRAGDIGTIRGNLRTGPMPAGTSVDYRPS